MVSKRKIRFNFCENEKVLCYEPDPKKAKVLYESRVLECCVGKDPNGKKCPQYLVHFYGWNSSWDRIVKECDIVKDNLHNRSLQRSLAEKAAIALKGKKLKLNKIPAIIKEIVVNSGNTLPPNDDNSLQSANNDTNGSDVDEELTQEDTDRHSSSSDDHNSWMSCRTSVRTSVSNDCNTMSATSETNTYEESDSQSLIYCLTNDLKAILDKDFTHCVIERSLYKLPIEPNVSQIIDEFTLNTNISLTSDPNSVITEENESQIVSEFKSSLEIYFNALIDNCHLFYNEEERQQLRQFQHQCKHKYEAKQTYGFVHLLRSLIAMPDFLLSTPAMTKRQLKIIVTLIKHFVDYLNKKKDIFH